MSERPDMQKLGDDDVRAILLAPVGVANEELAGIFGVSKECIRHNRARCSKRAIRLARELGIIPEKPAVAGWATHEIAAGVPA